MHCRRAPSTPTLLVKIFGRARVGFSTASGAVVMGEVGCVPLGRWQHTRRVAHASDERAIEREARIVFPICNVFDRGRSGTDRYAVGAMKAPAEGLGRLSSCSRRCTWTTRNAWEA